MALSHRHICTIIKKYNLALKKLWGGEQAPKHHKLDLYRLLDQASDLVHNQCVVSPFNRKIFVTVLFSPEAWQHTFLFLPKPAQEITDGGASQLHHHTVPPYPGSLALPTPVLQEQRKHLIVTRRRAKCSTAMVTLRPHGEKELL